MIFIHMLNLIFNKRVGGRDISLYPSPIDSDCERFSSIMIPPFSLTHDSFKTEGIVVSFISPSVQREFK